jgi:DNA-binding transcriptional LysR family regulator
VVLTEAGRVFLPHARNILEEIEDSAKAIHNLSETVSGTLTMATSHHIGLHRLPQALRAYSREYPQVDLDLKFMGSEAICSGVLSGALELGVVTLPRDPLPRLQTSILWPDPMEFVVGRSHPLATAELAQEQDAAGTLEGITLRHLTRYTAILPAPGTFTREMIDTRFQQQRLKLATKLTTNYLETIKMLVSVGLGWSVLPRTLIDKDLLVVKIHGVQIQRDLGAVWHSQRTLSNSARAMLSTLQES